MKKLLTLVYFWFLIINIIAQQNAEIKEALDFLNDVRSNPHKYSKEIGVNLSDVEQQPALVWNDTLANVAQRKAEDMAKRNYFAHVNPDGEGINILIFEAGYKINEKWILPKSSNFFESLSAGANTPKEGIINLINDNQEKNHQKAGHRLHLLGMTDFWENCTDIGIGFVYADNATYHTYMCVIIAKKQF